MRKESTNPLRREEHGIERDATFIFMAQTKGQRQRDIIVTIANRTTDKVGAAAPSLLRNRRLAAKDILLDLARRCFRQLGYEVNFLRTLEVRQMITSVIAQLGFRRGRACF